MQHLVHVLSGWKALMFSQLDASPHLELDAWMQNHIEFEPDANLDGFQQDASPHLFWTGCKHLFIFSWIQFLIYFQLDATCMDFNWMQTLISFELDASPHLFCTGCLDASPHLFSARCKPWWFFNWMPALICFEQDANPHLFSVGFKPSFFKNWMQILWFQSNANPHSFWARCVSQHNQLKKTKGI